MKDGFGPNIISLLLDPRHSHACFPRLTGPRKKCLESRYELTLHQTLGSRHGLWLRLVAAWNLVSGATRTQTVVLFHYYL